MKQPPKPKKKPRHLPRTSARPVRPLRHVRAPQAPPQNDYDSSKTPEPADR